MVMPAVAPAMPTGWDDAMDEERRELARHLYALMTEILEDATELAAAGQSPALDGDSCTRCGEALRRAADRLDALARAAVVIGELGKGSS